MKKFFTHPIQSLLAYLSAPEENPERGDVPGWVLVTMMSAILVAAILVVAQEALINMFNNAMSMLNR